MKKEFLALVFGVFLLGNTTFAEQQQEACFQTLKENVADIGVFSEGYETPQNLNYGNLNFSKFYKTNSLLGVELDEPLFEQRIYTFGGQTGLNNFVPFSPFADGKMTEKFDEKLKQFTIVENYLINENGEKVFLNCGLIKADAKDTKDFKIVNVDLGSLKTENSWYDGDVFSILKASPDYKTLYSVNGTFKSNDNAFDYEGDFSIFWNKLFVFPKTTQNDYFSFYDVIENVPLDEPTIFEEYEIYDFYGLKTDKFDDIEAEDFYDLEVFPYFSLWQTIEKKFPNFAKQLAFRGEIHFDTLKRLLQTKDNDDFSNIWDVVMNSKQFVKYLKAKEKGTLQQTFAGNEGMIEFYEYNEKRLDQTELRILSLLDEQNIIYEEQVDKIEENIENNVKDSDLRQNDTKDVISVGEVSSSMKYLEYIFVIIIAVVAIGSLVLFFRKKKQ